MFNPSVLIGGLIFFSFFSGLSFAEGVSSGAHRGIPTIFSDAKKINSLPPVILAGLDDYAIEGAEGALKTWVKGGPLEGDAKVMSSLQVFQAIEKYYGKYVNYTVLQEKDLAPNCRLIYIQMNYEKGPFFIRFMTYLVKDRWVVVGRLVLNSEPDEVL